MKNFNHKPKKVINFPKIFLFNQLTLKSVAAIIIVLSLFQLFIANNFVTYGQKIKAASLESDTIEAENISLSNQIQQLSALAYIEKTALDLGFKKAEKVEYVAGTTSVAAIGP